MKSAMRRLNAVTAAAVLLAAVCVVGMSRVAGQTALLPASIRPVTLKPRGNAVLLDMYLPG